MSDNPDDPCQWYDKHWAPLKITCKFIYYLRCISKQMKARHFTSCDNDTSLWLVQRRFSYSSRQTVLSKNSGKNHDDHIFWQKGDPEIEMFNGQILNVARCLSNVCSSACDALSYKWAGQEMGYYGTTVHHNVQVSLYVNYCYGIAWLFWNIHSILQILLRKIRRIL